ncbi:amino acid adenylation domain-containing protein [Catenulispora sp. GP43]|uniref:amino acid adenylation domain-containing protein n=1 Tax=Catenulispora sp. GP43 TaxID=3156263 RepID=UPI0035186FF2
MAKLEAFDEPTPATLTEVLLCAHVKVLAMLSGEPAFTTSVLWPGDDHPRTVVVAPRSAGTWRELVDHVRRSVHGRSPDGLVPDGEVQVLFNASGVPTVWPSALSVEANADSLFVRSDARLGEGAVDRIAALHRSVLEAMAAGADGDARSAVLPAAERHAVLEDWARGPSVPRGSVTVLELFQRSAASAPQATAVRAGGRVLTFRELDEHSTRIARLLIQRGVRPDTAVGVCLRRGLDLLPVLLAVWKIGAHYLPLDVDMPLQRLHRMTLAADCKLIVSSSEHRAVIAEGLSEPALVLIDEAAPDIAAQPETPLPTVLASAALAYVMYTSGSTGTPKGVMVHQGGLANYVLWTAQEYAGRGTGGSPHLTSIGFDLGVPSLLTPLIVGQCVDLLPDPLDPAALGALLVEGGPYSFVKITPGHLNLLGTELEPAQARDLAGLVIAAGDAFPVSLAHRWSRLAGPGGTRVATEYGPTEITVGNSGREVTGIRGEGLIPLGAPIPNTTMYVLDDLLEPVPVGVVGEIYVGGAGVAHGYLGAPSLTAERFPPDPYGPAGARLYRTGDRGCWSADGDLDFLGRVDHQVKIRGYRVEPGEVRTVLQHLPGVEESVVLARPLPRGARLAAFVVPTAQNPPDPAQLRAELAAQLPEHMLPEAVHLVACIPLTANGKVDAEALLSGLSAGASPGSSLPTANSGKQVPVTRADVETYRVVVNDEGQYSIWDVPRQPPAGWRPTGFEGPKDLCLRHIAEVWTDIRPLSARSRAAADPAGSSR